MTNKPDGNHTPDSSTAQPDMPLIEHLLELRNRLLKMVLAVVICFAAIYPFANELYLLMSQPLRELLPVGQTMIATDITSPFFAPLKLALVLAVFAAIPVILYQIWSFVAPGLYAHEKRLAFPLLFTSVILFYLGAAFAYFVVFPLVFGFFTAIGPEGIVELPDITSYLNFVLKMFFAFGVAFEIPIATILLVLTGAPRGPGRQTALHCGRLLCNRHAADASGYHFPDSVGGAHVVSVRDGHHLQQACGA